MSTHFNTAFSLWADAISGRIKLMHIAQQAGMPIGDIYRLRTAKKAVTYGILCKLLPIVASSDSEHAAISLLIAYLKDQTPETFEGKVRMESAVAPARATTSLLEESLAYIEARARQDADYATRIIGDYLLHRETDFTRISELIDRWKLEHAQASLYSLHQRPAAAPESQVILLAEPSAPYGEPVPIDNQDPTDTDSTAGLGQTPCQETAPSAASGTTTKGKTPTQGTKKRTRMPTAQAPAATAPIVPLRQHITPGPGAGIEQAAQ